jgi:UDP-2,4-diacetamido-2,4,6-trideoxy-beta-L-altropyranose hydrolase
MKVVIRADASRQSGAGHLMRCLALSDGIRKRGGEVIFVSRPLEGHLFQVIKREGYPLLPLSGQKDVSQEDDARETLQVLKQKNVLPDWLIVDCPAFDLTWERRIRPQVERLMVIEGSAGRKHECDLFHNHNFQRGDSFYDPFLQPSTWRLLGPQYALISDRLAASASRRHMRRCDLERIFVCFGGADFSDQFVKVLKAVQELRSFNLSTHVVLGWNCSNAEKIKRLGASIDNTFIHEGVSDLTPFMEEADLAIISGGTLRFEACCLGLPSLILAVAKDQEEPAEELTAKGACHYLGPKDEVSTDQIKEAIVKMRQEGEWRSSMADRARHIVDGLGVSRTADAMYELLDRTTVQVLKSHEKR